MPHELPDPTAFVENWRNLAHKAGFPGLFLVAISNQVESDLDLSAFDAVTPNGPGDFFSQANGVIDQGRITRGLKDFVRKAPTAVRLLKSVINSSPLANVSGPRRFDYQDLVEDGLRQERYTSNFIPCVVPNWDNTPRSGNRGVVVEGSTPDKFKKYLQGVSGIVSARPPENRLVFLKAWNEWAEGNYVEPDNQFGTGYLDAIRAVVF